MGSRKDPRAGGQGAPGRGLTPEEGRGAGEPAREEGTEKARRRAKEGQEASGRTRKEAGKHGK
eukprot:11360767-Heterocapsa_arctica.AAC.1